MPTTLAKDVAASTASGGDSAEPGVPPLSNGDRLSGAEYLRRYRAMPEVKKAELIEGRVYLGSPVSMTRHGGPHADMVGWLVFYRAFTPGVEVGDNTTTELDADNYPQPDACLRLEPKDGGKSTIGEHGYVYGPPELVVEVAATSAQYDLHEKMSVYRRTGVREYVVWRTYDNAIDCFVLAAGEYQRASLPEDGIYRSTIFPGLWLDVNAMLRRDMAGVLKVAQSGIGSEDHQAFVSRLRRAETE